MERLLKIMLWTLSFLCIYAISNIGLGKLWSLGHADNYIQINNVLINLSYSYIAGLIFYILISYFPNKIRSNKFRPIIQTKIDDLYNQINACVVTFQTKTDGDLIQDITSDNLEKSIVGNSMYTKSHYGELTGLSMDNFLFLSRTRNSVFDIIESLLQYRDFMSSEYVACIENIKDASYFHLIKNYETTAAMRIMYDTNEFKSEISKELYKIIEFVRVLNNK